MARCTTAYPPCPWKSKSIRIEVGCPPTESGCSDTSTPSAGAAVHCVTESNESRIVPVVAACSGVTGTIVGTSVGLGGLAGVVGFTGGFVGFTGGFVGFAGGLPGGFVGVCA